MMEILDRNIMDNQGICSNRGTVYLFPVKHHGGLMAWLGTTISGYSAVIFG